MKKEKHIAESIKVGKVYIGKNFEMSYNTRMDQ